MKKIILTAMTVCCMDQAKAQIIDTMLIDFEFQACPIRKWIIPKHLIRVTIHLMPCLVFLLPLSLYESVLRIQNCGWKFRGLYLC